MSRRAGWRWFWRAPLPAPGPKRLCRACRHFCNDPAGIEAAVPGLASLSSAFASARADDGLCGRHDRFVEAGSGCAMFLSRCAA